MKTSKPTFQIYIGINEIRGDIQITVSDMLEKDEYEDDCDIAD